VSPTSIWYFRSLCGAKYNACYFCCAVAHIFRLSFSLCSGFRCCPSELELCDFLSAALVGGVIPRSRSRVMLSIIIGVNILIWYGAVIVLGVRQSGEKYGYCILSPDVV